MAENDWLIGLTAGLDDSKSKEQIKKDIEKIKKDLTIALKVGKDYRVILLLMTVKVMIIYQINCKTR